VSAPVLRFDIDGAYGDTGFAARLARLAEDAGPPDSYGEGPVVAEAEALCARLLGKERAVLFPTGTLANLVALDRLCSRHARRVLLHPDSHILNDCGDALARLMGLTPVVAAAEGAALSTAAIGEAQAAARTGKVAQGLGAVVIETPYRRRFNEGFPPDRLDAVVVAAKDACIPLHLDGARLPMWAALCGVTMAEAAARFDTVYVSLWKMLGLPFGAVLAGPTALLAGVEHDRRQLGGALPQLWPLALAVLDGFSAIEIAWRETLSWQASLHAALEQRSVILTPVGPCPVNTVWIDPPDGDADAMRRRAADAGMVFGPPSGGRILLRSHPGLVGYAPEDVASRIAGVLRSDLTPVAHPVTTGFAG
jgi:threonine aldolase